MPSPRDPHTTAQPAPVPPAAMVSLSNLASHAVDALADDNLGMIDITDISAKYAVTAFPSDSIAWRPRWRDARGSELRAPGERWLALRGAPPGNRCLPDIFRYPVILRALYQVARAVDSS